VGSRGAHEGCRRHLRPSTQSLEHIQIVESRSTTISLQGVAGTPSCMLDASGGRTTRPLSLAHSSHTRRAMMRIMANSRPPVFDEKERTDPSPARNEESTFEFFNRVAGPYWDHPRQLIEEWCSHLKDDGEYMDVRNRIRSRNAAQYNGAFLELYVHEMLLRSGHTVAVHPSLPDTSRRPDFYAEKDGAGFYVEAINPGASRADVAAAARLNRLLDVVNRLHNPNFTLWLDELTEGRGDAAPARLRTQLERWLKTLNPDDVLDYIDAPRYRWTHDDWSAEFLAIPVDAPARGMARSDRRAISVYGYHPAQIENDAPLIHRALESKHSEYGKLENPFVIVVGVFIHDADRWHAANAFYGPERVTFSKVEQSQAARHSDGYFGAPGRWKHTNVSAVLLVNQLQPYHLDKTDAALWQHPGASHPVPPIPWAADTIQLVGTNLETTSAPVEALSFFGLPTPWPPGEPWPKD